MGVGNEGTSWCLDQASREYVIAVRVKQQVLVFFRSNFFKPGTESMFFLLKERQGKGIYVATCKIISKLFFFFTPV